MSAHWTRRSLAILFAVATIDSCGFIRPDYAYADRQTGTLGLPLRRERDRLTGGEIAATGLPTAYDAVAQLRGEFLQRSPHGLITTPHTMPLQVFVNGTPNGGVETLRWIPAHLVEEIRFISAEDTQSRFGPAYPRGLILVMTKK